MKARRLTALLTTLTTCLALAAPASAELTAFARITGTKQGAIKGSVIQKGREGSIAVIAVEHSIVSPRDPASGLATGKRQHKPFVITKEVDQSSTFLHEALTSNEALKDVTLEFWQPSNPGVSATGTERKYYTVKLENASIAGIRHVMPNNKVPELARQAAYEEISLVYSKITWTGADGATSTDDLGGK